MPSCIDLHMHSTASDGSDSPAKLLRAVTAAGIRTFALTDHDTVSGAVRLEQLLAAAGPDRPEFFRGIEFSCRSPVAKCHLLGYMYDFTCEQLQDALGEGRSLRRAKLNRRLRHLKEVHGIIFGEYELDWLYGLPSAGKPHISNLLIRRGLAKTIKEAIRRYIDDGPKVKGPSDRIPSSTAISGILAADGIPVWAHPLGGENEKHLTPDEFRRRLEVLIEEGIRGLECHYSRYTPEEVRFLRGEAERNGLLISGGSDYHGQNKDIPLGTLGTESPAVDESLLTILPELRARL